MRYRKKLVVVDAIQFDGYNYDELERWSSGKVGAPNKMLASIPRYLLVNTPQGEIIVIFSDWIIRDSKGDYYQCENDEFIKTYELIKE